MAISASGHGGTLVRVDPADTDALVGTANATLAVMGGRTMQGWLRVSSEDLEADEQLTRELYCARGCRLGGEQQGAGLLLAVSLAAITPLSLVAFGLKLPGPGHLLLLRAKPPTAPMLVAASR
jgi:hypothetical protein